MPYIPKKPTVTLEQLIETHGKLYSNSPNKYSLPGFHNNFYVRMLASHPKQEMYTGRCYPSAMLAKVGITGENRIGPIKIGNTSVGKRVYISPYSKDTSVLKNIKRYFIHADPVYNSYTYNCEPTDVKNCLLDTIRDNLQHYNSYTPPEPKPPVVCYIISSDDQLKADGTKSTQEKDDNLSATTSTFDVRQTELATMELPYEIIGTRDGLYLAGNIYKFLYSNRLL